MPEQHPPEKSIFLAAIEIGSAAEDKKKKSPNDGRTLTPAPFFLARYSRRFRTVGCGKFDGRLVPFVISD
jgi:hypothetical protein